MFGCLHILLYEYEIVDFESEILATDRNMQKSELEETILQDIADNSSTSCQAVTFQIGGY